jgi:hypothetical protein
MFEYLISVSLADLVARQRQKQNNGEKDGAERVAVLEDKRADKRGQTPAPAGA